MTTKYLNGHIMSLEVVYGMGEVLEEFTVWCHTCDPKGEQLIFQRDCDTTAQLEQAIQDGVVQAKLHATLDVTSN